MPIKTFSQAEQLTAADTNTYLNNGGLVWIAQNSATSGTTLVINNCFSATYDAYKIVVWDMIASVATVPTLQLGSTTSGYYGAYLTVTNAGTVSSGTNSNAGNWNLNLVANSSGGSGCTIELQNPYLAKNTIMQASGSDNRTNGEFIRFCNGYLNNTTSYTGLTLSFGSGTITSYKAAVYGYRIS